MKGDVTERDVELSPELEEAEQLAGSLASDPDEERLMRSVLEHDEDALEDGKLVMESVNRSVGTFTPDMLFEQLTKSFRNAERLYGETLIRAVTGYAPDYVRKNLKIPEFQQELKHRIEQALDGLEERGLVDKEGRVTEHAMKLAALVLYSEELEHLESKGLGRQARKERDVYGDRDEVVPFGHHRFRDVSLRRSIRTALRRGRGELRLEDLQAHERSHRGRIQVVYGVDSSGSMRGEKLRMAKRAGVALAYHAIEARDEVGLLTFTGRVESVVAPTRDFPSLLRELAAARAGLETDLQRAMLESVNLFSGETTKHLVLLTDALPTKGEQPQRDALEAAGVAASHDITISIVGIQLDEEGRELAQRIVDIAHGRLYRCSDLEELDTIILEDYAALAR